jgi:hypothetical protein
LGKGWELLPDKFNIHGLNINIDYSLKYANKA